MELTERDRRSIQALIRTAQEAQNDVEALLALHTPDTVIVNIAGRRVLGRDQLRAAMSAALASPLADVRTTVDVLDVRLATPDAAVVSCVKTVHDGRSQDQPALPARGAMTYLLVRDGDGWLVAAAQTTPVPAAPAGEAPRSDRGKTAVEPGAAAGSAG